jgi:hypothetical protein
MSGYVTKLKARREECYSLQAGEAPLAFSRRLGGGGLRSAYECLCRRSGDRRLRTRLEGRFRNDPLDPWRRERRGFPPVGGGPLPLALLLI